jgi:putative membrane protein
MLIAAIIVASVAALFHVVVFFLESVLWTRPAVYGRFGITSQNEANTIRTMAYNQGFYNLALAIGVAVGVVLLTQTGDVFVAGKALVIFGTACMSIAGIVLASSGRAYLRSATLQFVPAAVALVLTIVAHR